MSEVRKVVRCYSHIPMVGVPDDVEPIELLEGLLGRLPSPVWLELDASAAAHLEGFERTGPVFFQAAFGETEDNDLDTTFRWAWQEFDRDLYLLYFALLLATGARIPEPDLSKQYYHDPEPGSATPRDAAFSYEAVAYCPPGQQIPLDARLLQSLPSRIEAVRRGGHILALPIIQYLRDTLFTLARPEFTDHDDAVQCTAALEAVLVPEPTRGITRVFARRGASLIGHLFQDPGGAPLLFAAVYDLRSRIVHGDNPLAVLEKLAAMLPALHPTAVPRYLLCRCLDTLLGLSHADPSALESTRDFAGSLDDRRVTAVDGAMSRVPA